MVRSGKLTGCALVYHSRYSPSNHQRGALCRGRPATRAVDGPAGPPGVRRRLEHGCAVRARASGTSARAAARGPRLGPSPAGRPGGPDRQGRHQGRVRCRTPGITSPCMTGTGIDRRPGRLARWSLAPRPTGPDRQRRDRTQKSPLAWHAPALHAVAGRAGEGRALPRTGDPDPVAAHARPAGIPRYTAPIRTMPIVLLSGTIGTVRTPQLEEDSAPMAQSGKTGPGGAAKRTRDEVS